MEAVTARTLAAQRESLFFSTNQRPPAAAAHPAAGEGGAAIEWHQSATNWTHKRAADRRENSSFVTKIRWVKEAKNRPV
jgi:hypothetical protein